jgi:hypothetical protein
MPGAGNDGCVDGVSISSRVVPDQFTRRAGSVHASCRLCTPDEVKRAAVTLYGYGLSLNAVGHLLGSCAQSVMRWVCSYVDHTCPKPEPEPVPIIEVDEMWHYVHRRTNGSVSFQVRTTMGCSSDVVKSYCILWLSPES